MSELCIGATSQLVVEEAARLGVAQIIASRRQVNADGGYTGMTQDGLVKIVRSISDKTLVVRDHGGPYQNGETVDDWVSELDHDVHAGFDGLHLDVSKLPREEQRVELVRLAERYATRVRLQVGGERDPQEWLNTLLAVVMVQGITPTHCVVQTDSMVLFDRQAGRLRSTIDISYITKCYREMGTRSVAHNMDFVADRRTRFGSVVSAINLAPEIAVVETDAWLRAMPLHEVQLLLQRGHDSGKWQRWFKPNHGTRFERARCGLRYIWAMELPRLQEQDWYPAAEVYVREEVQDAIAAG